jgi:hypothetical protein
MPAEICRRCNTVDIDDFATKIPDEMDIIFTAFEGWPGFTARM